MTERNRILLKKPMPIQLVEIFPAFYITRKFTALITKAYWTLTSPHPFRSFPVRFSEYNSTCISLSPHAFYRLLYVPKIGFEEMRKLLSSR